MILIHGTCSGTFELEKPLYFLVFGFSRSTVCVARRNFYVGENEMLVVKKTKILKYHTIGAGVPPIPNYEPCQTARSTSHYNHYVLI